MFWRRFVCEARRRVPVALLSRNNTVTLLQVTATCRSDPFRSAARFLSSTSPATKRQRSADSTSPKSKISAFRFTLYDDTSPQLTTRILRACSPILEKLPLDIANRRNALMTLFNTLGRHGSIPVLDRALPAAQDLLELEVDDELHNAILEGFVSREHFSEASSWLRDLPNKPGACSSSVQQWNDFLETCLTHGQPRLAWANVRYIQDNRPVKPDSRTYSLFFQTIFLLNRKNPPPTSFLRSVLDRMKEDAVPFSADLLQVIVGGYNSMNALGMARPIERIYASMQGKKKLARPAPDAATFDTTLVDLFADGKEKRAQRELRRMVSSGFRPTTTTLDNIAPYLSNPEDLLSWEALLGIAASHSAWSSVMRNVAEADSAQAVVTTYRAFLESKHIPTAVDISCVLTVLCSRTMRPPTDNDIRQAISLFQEYVQLVTSDAAPGHSPQGDLPAYNTLLRAICSSANPEFYPIAVSLLEEIQDRGIVMDHLATRSFIILFIRVAPDADAAYRIYRKLHKYPDGSSALDAKGFEAVLDTFCQVCLSHAPSSALYLSIVRDMRLAGYPVTATVYTILLRRLSDLVWQARSDAKLTEELAHTIRRVHNAITVDASITPDVALWNQLMDTYQRAGCIREAYGIWESLYMTRQFNNASVSVVLDACSHAGAEELAMDVFAKVYASGFQLNQRNWANWVECLCRLGKIDEATKVLCVAMPQEKEKGVHPTKEIAQIILNFAANQRREEEIRDRIKHYLPKLIG